MNDKEGNELGGFFGDEKADNEGEVQFYDSADYASYSQSLSNSLAAVAQYDVKTEEDIIFIRMQIKRLVDTQIRLSSLFFD
tara:strand:- start:13740 stop:13982 length:243 start_codon:yes stop_codon:yes gene_type:complete